MRNRCSYPHVIPVPRLNHGVHPFVIPEYTNPESTIKNLDSRFRGNDSLYTPLSYTFNPPPQGGENFSWDGS
jgi:hypothetical protein